MTFYAFVLFIHIASAFFLFAGLVLEWTAFSFLCRTTDVGGIQQWARTAGFSAKLYGPAIGLILLSGGYLGGVLKAWSQPWLPASLLVLVIAGVIGAALAAPRVRALKKLNLPSGGGVTADVRARVRDPILIASSRIRVALILGVLLLMVTKVDLHLSVAISVSALAIGLVSAIPLWKRRPGLAASN
jgi:Predicted integral membrane protein (DUF2269)